MSNHSGSYLLNDVLKKLEEFEIFELLGKEKNQQLVLDIIDIGQACDCNSGEILEDIGSRLGICYYCLKPAEEFADDAMCINCEQELDPDDSPD